MATARSPSAGLPIASERATVSGLSGTTLRSSAKAVATGAQPSAWPPYRRGASPSTSPSSAQLGEALVHLREERAGGDRAGDGRREPPAELLGDLERDRLRALGVVGAKSDVDERPVELERELDREPAAVVVASVDGVDRRAVDGGRDQLLGLEVGRAEDDRLDPLGCRARGDRVREVAGRRARERRRAELERLRAGDGDDAILERVRRVGGVELEVELADPERAREPRGRDERREARCEARLRGRLDGKERRVAPDRGGACRDRLAGERRPHGVPVVDGIERPEAGRADTDRLERVLALTDPTPKSGSWHDDLPFLARHIRPGLAPCFDEPVAEASQGRSLSLSRCGARHASLPASSIQSEVNALPTTGRDARRRGERSDRRAARRPRRRGAGRRARRSSASGAPQILAANAADVDAARGQLDEGTLDRLRLDDARVDGARAPGRGDGRDSSRSSAR